MASSALALPRLVSQAFWALAGIAWVWLLVTHAVRGAGSGQPYVQYRGGPPGFLKVIGVEAGASLLAWADFRGNRQHLSTGNLRASDRVSLFLMD